MKPKYLGKALTFGDLIANCYHAYGKYKVQGFCGLLSKVAASDFAAMRRATERMGAQVGSKSVKTSNFWIQLRKA